MTRLFLILAWCGAALAQATPPGAALAIGERRAVLVDAVDEAYALPEGTVDVARMGPRTVVVTGRRAGAAELRVLSAGREWSMPLDVRAAPTDDAPHDVRVKQRIIPVPPPRTADAEELAESDFLPRPEIEPEPVLARSLPRRDAFDDAYLGAPIIHGEPAGPAPMLTGVLRTAQGPVALLNGSPVGVGERTGEYTVVSVADDSAVLDCRGRTLTLRLSGR